MSNITLNTFTKPEANVLLDFITEKSNQNKKLEWLQKSKGQFYTHKFIGEKLANNLVSNLKVNNSKETITIIDPFCGDGRLICNLLQSFYEKGLYEERLLEISIWDIDIEAVQLASCNIKEKAEKLNFKVKILEKACDTFLHADSNLGYFDICITNPPWLIIKPDKKEKDTLSETEQREYLEALKNFDDFLNRYYPISMPTKKYGGWGTNLARCGTEVALRLISKDGICGIVSPASLIGDQVSNNLRDWIFNNYQTLDISYYVAEAKLFGKVDQATINLTFSPKNISNQNTIPKLTFYDKFLTEKTYFMDSEIWSFIESQNYVIPLQFGFGLLKLHKLFSSLPTMEYFEKYEGLWLGREIDETRIGEKLINKGQHPFIKGKMINRYSSVPESLSYLDVEKIKRIPKSVGFNRVVWRDVSRTSQKRRLIATMIPPQYITGNSLHVAYFKDNNIKKLSALLAVMNSLIFEAQVRAFSSTNHMSLGVIRKTRLPKLNDDEINLLAQYVSNYEIQSEYELEVEVAKLYGLSFEEFCDILGLFEKLTNEEKDELKAKAKNVLRREYK